MASERLAALHRHLAEETARLLGWEAGQEVAARDREARILHLEQLAAASGRQVAAAKATNAALRAELAEAGQRREELELRVAHVLREVDVLEAEVEAACGEAGRLVGAAKRPAQEQCLKVEDLSRAVHRLGLVYQEEVVARRHQEEVVVREAAMETTTLADHRSRLQEQLLGTRGLVDAGIVNLQKLRKKAKVYMKAVKEQREHEESIKKEQENVKIEQERVKKMTVKKKEDNFKVEKKKVAPIETRRQMENEEKESTITKEKLESVAKVEQKLQKDKEVREDEVADLATTTEAQGSLVAEAARRVEGGQEELAALRQAAAAAEEARRLLNMTERDRRLAESEAGAMEGVRELRQQLAEEYQAYVGEIEVCEERLQMLNAEKQSKKEKVEGLQRKAREARENWRSSEELTSQQKVEIGRLAKAVVEMKEGFKVKEVEVSVTVEELANKGKEKDQMEQWLGQHIKEKEETRKKLETVEEDCKVLSEKLGSMKVSKSDLEKEVRELSIAESNAEASVLVLKKKETAINRKASDEDGEDKEIQIKEDELIKEVQRLVKTTEEIAKDLAQMEVEKASQMKVYSAMTEEVEAKKDELVGVKSEVKTLMKQLEAVPTVGEAGEVQTAIAEMATELERMKTELTEKTKEEEEMVNFAEELRASAKASKEKQAEASRVIKATKARFKSGKKMEADSTAALQLKAKELAKMEAKLAKDTAEAAELVTKEKLVTDTLAKWQERVGEAKEEQQVAAERFTAELHRMAEEVMEKVEQATELKEELKKETEEKRRQLRATKGESRMEQGNTSRAASTVIGNTLRSPRTLSILSSRSSRSSPSSARPAPDLFSLRRGPAGPSVSTILGNSRRPGSTVSATSSRLGAASSNPSTSTPCSSNPPPLFKPSSIKSGRLAPARRPAGPVEKRKGDVDNSAIFDVSSSDPEPKLFARSPRRPVSLGPAVTPCTSSLGPVTPGTPGRPQLADSRARSRLWLGRGQAGTPPAPVIGVSDSCFDSTN